MFLLFNILVEVEHVVVSKILMIGHSFVCVFRSISSPNILGSLLTKEIVEGVLSVRSLVVV